MTAEQRRIMEVSDRIMEKLKNMKKKKMDKNQLFLTKKIVEKVVKAAIRGV